MARSASKTGSVRRLPDDAYDAVVPAPFGALGIASDGSRLTEIVFLPASTALRAPANALAGRAAEQLGRYFQDPAAGFDLPLDLSGTPFRLRVWQAIAAIPLGEVRTYGELASSLASAPRAIGQACGDNPFPLVIPCHRVVGRSALGGFAHQHDGDLLDAKRWLLRHEGILR